MDTLTHALSGALLARATTSRTDAPGSLSLRARVWVCAAAAAFPDSDFLLTLIGPLTYLNGHRGITHSLLLLPLWSVLLALLFTAVGRGRYHWRGYVGICAQGIGIHIAGDVITSYGTQIFAPLSHFSVAWPYTFIIDPYFTGIILFGLFAGWRWQSPHIARLALFILASYVGAQAGLQHAALLIATRQIATQHLTGASAQALPQPFSPFSWKLIIAQGDNYQETYVNLLTQTAPAPAPDQADIWIRLRAQYRPANQLIWLLRARFGDAQEAPLARQVWARPEFSAYRRFAVYPALYRIDTDAAQQCVWFVDLRFTIDALTPPFRYGLCRANDSAAWQLRSLARDYLKYD